MTPDEFQRRPRAPRSAVTYIYSPLTAITVVGKQTIHVNERIPSRSETFPVAIIHG
jgi:hypothetical protein